VIGVAVSEGVKVGNSTVAVGNGDGESSGRGVRVFVVIGTLVSVARGAGIVGAADGVADSAGAVQANAIARSIKSRINKRFLSNMTSSVIGFFSKYNEATELFNKLDWEFSQHESISLSITVIFILVYAEWLASIPIKTSPR